MNNLQFDKQISAIAALTEGMSIRATERLTGIHRDTIMRLGVRVGQGCATVHDAMMRNLHVNVIQMDEIWGYVGKKQQRTDSQAEGDQYTFLAMDSIKKAIISFRTGKRVTSACNEFVDDIAKRVVNRPQITSDGFQPYADAVDMAFGGKVDYARITKVYRGVAGNRAQVRYSPGAIVSVEKEVVLGQPKERRISTSHIERVNLSLRMQQRRFTRLTNGFSKKLENHKAAVALFVAHYNLCRVHEALRITPAMALGVTDHIWTIGDLVEAALTGSVPVTEGRRVGAFRVLDGGKD